MFTIRRFLIPICIHVLVMVVAGCGNDPLVFPVLEAEQLEQGYVGSDRCNTCHGPYLPATFHPTYHADWAASAHGKTVDTEPSEQTIVADMDGDGTSDFVDGLDLGTLPAWAAYVAGDFAPVLGVDDASGGYFFAIGARVFAVEKILGIGRHQQTYLTRIGESLYVLPGVYDVEARNWRPLQPEHWYVWDDVDENGYIDSGEAITGLLYGTAADSPVSEGRTGDSWERSCAGCHTTGLTSVLTNADGEFLAKRLEDGVSCEACHGPGQIHADTTGGKNLPNRAIVNPGKLTASQHRDLCMSCHSRGSSAGSVGGDVLDFAWRADDTPFLPGQVLAEAFTIAGQPREPIHALQGAKVHMGQDCQVCHTSHNTTNLALIRLTIQTPTSGFRDVVFTARSGAPGSGGLMGDATDGTFTDVCEVCHTSTRYFRNDDSAPSKTHHNGERCTDCHEHSEGFRAFESPGGLACDECHGDLATAMLSVTADTRHLLDDVAANYPTDVSRLNCLSCHVDHDIFAPANRAANLRTDIADVPTASTGSTNRDFLDSGGGGICLSCHTAPLAKSYVRPDGSLATPSIPFSAPVAEQVAAYASNLHSYTIPSEFGGSGITTFQADCSKCHNDDLDPKSSVAGQRGAIQFGLHKSTHARMLSPLGSGGAVGPQEEDFCYRCHSGAGDPIGGDGKPRAGWDWYDGAEMSLRSEDIWAATGATFGHPVDATRGAHTTTEGTAPNWNPASGRHVECADCHNPHAAGPQRAFDLSGTFAQPLSPSRTAAGTPLNGVWGVDVSWPAAWTKPDPASGFTRTETSEFTWQVCMKCHSGYAYGNSPPAGQTDQALEFNPNNPSYHAVVGASKTTAPPNSSFVAPWTKTSEMSCSDCHSSNVKTGAQGPHGSAFRGVLAGQFDTTTGQAGTSNHLCFKCHGFDVYGRDGQANGSATGFSTRKGKNLHTYHTKKKHFSKTRRVTCSDCHASIPHGWKRRALLVVDSDPAPYNNGSVGLAASDIPNWSSSGNWKEKNCDNSKCH